MNTTLEAAREDRLWLLLLHLSSLLPIVVVALLIWAWRRDEDPVIERHGVDVLNFQITMAICLFSAAVLILLAVGLFLLPLLGVFITVVAIFNTAKVAAGQDYYYPFSYPFLSSERN